jgi:DNA polymerase/3'-5' exonuclease PolX
MRIHAKSLNMKLNEYGLFKYDNNNKIQLPIASEVDIFKHLLLKYIPPDKR